MKGLTLPALLIAAACATGCTGRIHGTTTVAYSQPELLYVSPGVSVVADYEEPVFYSNNYYWRYGGGTWYRSSYYDRGWVVARPPSVVARIDSPYRYRHYRPGHTVTRRDYRDRRPVYRDYRDQRRDDRGYDRRYRR